MSLQRRGAVACTVMVLVFGTMSLLSLVPRALSAQTPPSDDPALLRELAERLLSFRSAGGQARVHLYPGAFPPDFAFDLQLPPGSRLVGSEVAPVAFGPDPAAMATTVVADTTTSPADVLAFYQAQLTGQGWSAAPQFGFRPGGFLPSALPAADIYCQSATGLSLNIVVYGRTSGANDLLLQLTTPDPNRCNPQQPTGPRPPVADLLPALLPPPGVTIGPSSFGGGGGVQSATGVARTDMTVGELERFYAQQLVAAGWMQVDGAAQGVLAWSAWSLPGTPVRQGFLSGLAGPGAGQRSLELRVASADDSGGVSNATLATAAVWVHSGRDGHA